MGRRAPNETSEVSRGKGCRVASEIKPGGKLFPYLICMDNNSSKSFFQVLLLSFMAKLEKNPAGHDECRPRSWLTLGGGLAVLVKRFYPHSNR